MFLRMFCLFLCWKIFTSAYAESGPNPPKTVQFANVPMQVVLKGMAESDGLLTFGSFGYRLEEIEIQIQKGDTAETLARKLVTAIESHKKLATSVTAKGATLRMGSINRIGVYFNTDVKGFNFPKVGNLRHTRNGSVVTLSWDNLEPEPDIVYVFKNLDRPTILMHGETTYCDPNSSDSDEILHIESKIRYGVIPVKDGVPGNLLQVISSNPLKFMPYAPNGRVGVPYQHSLTAFGEYVKPLRWEISRGALPPGLALEGATGTISGTPVATPGSGCGVKVVDANGQQAEYTVNIEVE
jgi:hypothetical protein